ncbi:Asp23/Gls24 family envelope stress response protein [Streptomyces odontomachi]|uniref:Asp23/Gls24 family envelope stress response protein n=1 Tax=Streptomyces odontomachi TaxID=2944940 RepID=UPI00210C00D4|nr:Asp23/Gls24 family envelope stress response protein [Streptomyces sp. ODS25]
MPDGSVAAAERGATRIADRVVAKIASHAAREAVGPLPLGGAAPHASVAVHQHLARVRVSIDLDFPTDIGARCAAVRRRVIQRVEALAGMAVPEVIVQVERLHSARTRGEGQGRTR